MWWAHCTALVEGHFKWQCQSTHSVQHSVQLLSSFCIGECTRIIEIDSTNKCSHQMRVHRKYILFEVLFSANYYNRNLYVLLVYRLFVFFIRHFGFDDVKIKIPWTRATKKLWKMIGFSMSSLVARWISAPIPGKEKEKANEQKKKKKTRRNGEALRCWIACHTAHTWYNRRK